MKIIKSLAILVFASAMFIACGGNSNKGGEGKGATEATKEETKKEEVKSSSNDPKGVVESYMKASLSYDFSEAKKYCSKESAAAIEEAQKQMENMPADQLKAVKDMTKDTKVEVVGDAKVAEDGNTATVEVKMTVMGQETIVPVQVVKEDGNWKVSM